MAIEAIFFDIGNVLIGVEWQGAGAEIRMRTALSRKEIQACFMNSGFEQYELGRISRTTFFSRLKDGLDFQGTAEELCRLSSEIFVPIEQNIALARALVPHYTVGIISNTNEAHIAYVAEQFDFLPLFEPRIYSHEVGLRKPDPAIYRLACERVGMLPGQCLFIDDLEVNVTGARALGWRAIEYRPELDLARALVDCGVRVEILPGAEP